MKKESFICDNCLDRIDKEVWEPYPYSSGWVYIYKFEYKLSQAITIEGDLHFCSKNCMANFLNNLINNENKILDLSDSNNPLPISGNK